MSSMEFLGLNRSPCAIPMNTVCILSVYYDSQYDQMLTVDVQSLAEILFARPRPLFQH